MKKNRLRAVIDVGSHSIRMFIGEVVRKGVVRQLEYLWVPIAIGNDTFSSGKIFNSTIHEVIRILKNFQEVMESYQVQSYKAIATSSMRDASNSETMLERIQTETGMLIEIIEPLTEMMIVYSGVAGLFRDRYGFQSKNYMVFSLGAGTAHISCQSEGQVYFTSSSNEGTLRLVREFDLPETMLPMNVQFNAHRFLESMWRFPDNGPIERLIAVNDDVFNLVRAMKPDREVRGIFRFTVKQFSSLAAKFHKKTNAEIHQRYSLNESILKTTRVAFLLIEKIMEMTGAKEIYFPEMAMGTSMMNWLSLVDEDYFSALTMYFQEHIITEAHNLGKKFKYDKRHTDRVEHIALLLFDQLRSVYGFSERERLYLRVAVILHNIGYFLGSQSHHKSSAMLIASSEILGLRADEMQLIAQIARYHRRAMPREEHSAYQQLTRQQRMIVQRMAAILRVADALSSIHLPPVEDIRVCFEGDVCILKLKITAKHYEYMELIEQLVNRKGDLFEEFFGLPIEIDRISV